MPYRKLALVLPLLALAAYCNSGKNAGGASLGSMLSATLLGTFLIPVFFVAIGRLSIRKRSPE